MERHISRKDVIKLTSGLVLAATLSGCATPNTQEATAAPIESPTCTTLTPEPLASKEPAYPDFNKYIASFELRPGTKLSGIINTTVEIGPEVDRLRTWKLTDKERAKLADGFLDSRMAQSEDFVYTGTGIHDANGLHEIVEKPSLGTDYQSGSSWLEYFSTKLGRFVAIDVTNKNYAPYITLPEKNGENFINVENSGITFNAESTTVTVDTHTILDLENGLANIFYADQNCNLQSFMITK